MKTCLHPVILLLTLCMLGCSISEPAGGSMLTSEHRIEADGHALALYEKRGPAANATILLIHGRTWSGKPDFDLQVSGEELSLMDALAELGYATYSLDLRGYGGTARDQSGFTTPDRSAADVATALRWIADHSGISGRPVLFGWSFGAMVSHLTAQQHSLLLSRLVLYGHPYAPDRNYPANQGTDQQPEYRVNTAAAARSDFITKGSISEHAIHSYVDASLAADPLRSDWQHLDQFNALDPALLSMPTLIIRGEFDPFAKLEAQRILLQRLANPNSRLITLSGGDHAVHLERPRAFVEALQAFLDRNPQAPRD